MQFFSYCLEINVKAALIKNPLVKHNRFIYNLAVFESKKC